MINYPLSRRLFLKKLSFGTLFLSFPIATLSCNIKRKNPNIVLINVDDLGWTDLGCYGSKYYETPNIDQLATQGVRFTNAYAAAAVCSPTRASIMTGKYPARHGITDWIRAEFQGGGTKNINAYTQNSSKKLVCPLNPFHMDLSEVTIAEILKQRGYSTCHIGKWHLGTNEWYPENQGFDINVAGCDYGQPPSYFDPYIMYHNNLYPDAPKGFPTMKSRSKGEYLTDREADEALGNIMNTLEDLNLMSDTIIIFTSDNGGLLKETATDNAPLRSGKGYPYEGGIRIPLIIKWPSFVEENSISEIPVISPDIFSTICDIVRIDIPNDIQIDGKSLLPILISKGNIDRDAIFWHFPHYRGNDIKPYSIVRSGEWKLIKNYEEESFELYNLHNDISESQDLFEKFPEKVVELDKLLTVWLTEVDAKLPKKNPNYTQPVQNPITS